MSSQNFESFLALISTSLNAVIIALYYTKLQPKQQKTKNENVISSLTFLAAFTSLELLSIVFSVFSKIIYSKILELDVGELTDERYDR